MIKQKEQMLICNYFS